MTNGINDAAGSREAAGDWFLRSMSDRDTHRGTYSITTRSVHALCGAEFEPLKRSNGAPIVLTPAPPDPDQVCRECRGRGWPVSGDGRHGGGLDLGDEVLLLILTRVREGRIWRHYREYLDDGRHVWAHVAWALEGMLECDHLRLGEVGPDGSQRVDLAERGLANYTRLGRRLVGARDEADEPRGCIIVGCGCRRTVWASGRVDECTCDGGSPGGAS